MLQFLREKSTGWVIKGLFVILVLSFGLWGIGDVFRGYTQMRPVAKVGNESITYEDLNVSLKAAQNRLVAMTKSKITQKQMQEMKLHRQVLDSLINDTLIEAEAKTLKLNVPDMRLQQMLHSIPAFQDKDGRFNRAAFYEAIRSSGLSEKKFIHEIKSEIIQNQIFVPLTSGYTLPLSYAKSLFKALEQKKVFVIATLKYDDIKLDEVPTDSTLKQFFDNNAAAFKLPETRKVECLIIDAAVLKEKLTLKEEEIKEAYEARKEEYTKPAEATLFKLSVPDMSTAKVAYEKLKKGRPGPAVARDTNGSYEDLGVVTKEELPDIAADKVFSLKAGEVSEPIKTPFGIFIYKVMKKTDKKVTPFSEVREKLVDELKTTMINEEFVGFKDKIEDSLAAGTSLKDTAKQFGLKVISADALDNKGYNGAGAPAFEESVKGPLLHQIVTLSFETPVGEDSILAAVNETQAVVVKVISIKEAYTPSFDSIKNTKVKQFWEREARYQKSLKIASEVIEKVKKSPNYTTFKEATKAGFKVQEIKPFSRTELEGDKKIAAYFGSSLLVKMYNLKENQAEAGPSQHGINIAFLKQALPLAIDESSKDFENFLRALRQMAQRDFKAQIILSLKKVHSVEVNEEILQQLFGKPVDLDIN